MCPEGLAVAGLSVEATGLLCLSPARWPVCPFGFLQCEESCVHPLHSPAPLRPVQSTKLLKIWQGQSICSRVSPEVPLALQSAGPGGTQWQGRCQLRDGKTMGEVAGRLGIGGGAGGQMHLSKTSVLLWRCRATGEGPSYGSQMCLELICGSPTGEQTAKVQKGELSQFRSARHFCHEVSALEALTMD